MDGALAADRACLEYIDTEISVLERSISALREQRAHVQERLDSYRYPVMTLPTEIASEIFIKFLPVYPVCPSLLGSDSSTLLTQICRGWREIALATSKLWRTISFHNHGLHRVPFEEQLRLCQIWLARSQSCPLNIQFRDLHELEMPQVFEMIAPHRARWECLEFAISASNVAAIEGPVPMLRHLDLTMHGRPHNVVTFSPAPLLRSITLERAFEIALPWGQLTSLTLHLAARDEYAAILRRTPNLVHCRLSYVYDRGGTSVIKLPCLESLSFGLADVPDTTRCLDDFTVPALRSLRLPEYLLGPKPIDDLSAFISKCGCKLQKVCVADIKLVSEASYIEAFPSIQQFCFSKNFD
ncbi:hypothetical protein K438DRAFT_1865740 [Mycena galopus ATCC 62051]|nr:hypothetical protein K438DRAFT_1865740 [Mycena galopus ATCC 62051]